MDYTTGVSALWHPVGVGQWKARAGDFRVVGKWDCSIYSPGPPSAGPLWSGSCVPTPKATTPLCWFSDSNSSLSNSHWQPTHLPSCFFCLGVPCFHPLLFSSTSPSVLVFLYSARIPITSSLHSPQTLPSEYAICFRLGPWLYTMEP